jgi:hypothetical protein
MVESVAALTRGSRGSGSIKFRRHPETDRLEWDGTATRSIHWTQGPWGTQECWPYGREAISRLYGLLVQKTVVATARAADVVWAAKRMQIFTPEEPSTQTTPEGFAIGSTGDGTTGIKKRLASPENEA